MFKKYKYHFFLLLAGVCYSSLSLFSALLTGQEVTAFTQILWRAAFGCLTSAIVLTVIFKERLSIRKNDLKYLFINSLILVGGFSTFILSIYLKTPIAKAVALVYVYPLSLVPLSYILFKEKPTAKQLSAIVLSLISLVLLLEVWKIKNLTEITLGEILAFVNSIFSSLIIIFGKIIRTKTKLQPSKTITYSMFFLIPLLWIVGFVLNVIGIPILKPEFSLNFNWPSWLGLFGLGFFGTTLAMTFLYLGLSKIKTTVVGVLLLTEPVWVYIWGLLIFSQTMSLWGILGMLGIIASVLLV